MNPTSVLFKAPLLTAVLFSANPASGALVHRWSFDTVNDSVGTANVTLLGTASVSGGQLELPGGAPRTNYGSVPGLSSTLSANQTISVEAWFTADQVANWSKVWMFGTAGNEPGLSYIDYTPRTGLAGNLSRIDFNPTTGDELNTGGDAGAAILTGTEYFIATVYDSANDLMSLYTNGVLTDSASMGGGNITQLGVTAENFLGAAVNFGDPDLDGRINEMRVFTHALSANEIALHNTLGPNAIPEPSAALMGLLAGAAGFLRRRRN